MSEIPTDAEFKKPLRVGDQEFLPGQQGKVHLPIGHLITHDLLTMRVHVIRGKRPGPRLFVSAGVHGDEINGVEIVRRLLATRAIRRLRGDLIAIPVMNLPAFMNRTRYLPDRRDLNRLFPGSTKGSLGARLARVFVTEVAKKCSHGIDLHTGAVNRPNLPQIRFSGDVEANLEWARSFRAPVAIQSSVREGSVRDVMNSDGKPLLMYEAGEAENLDPVSVQLGVRGVIHAMRHIGMLPAEKSAPSRSVVSRETWWERVPRGGVFMPAVELGKPVSEGTLLGTVADPFSENDVQVLSSGEGVVIGRTRQALVDEGDGIFHIATTRDPEKDGKTIDRTEEQFDQNVFDDNQED